MNKAFLFMRHAQSLANAGYPSRDAWTLPLTDVGHAQAADAAGQWVASREMRSGGRLRLISSPMLRAVQSAGHVKNAVGGEIEVIYDWHEFIPFDFSELGVTTPMQRVALMANHWNLCDPETVGQGAGAESFRAFFHRILRAATEVLDFQQESDITLVVTHGGVIKLLQLLERRSGRPDASSQLMRDWHEAEVVQNAGIVGIDLRKVVAR